MGLPSGWAEFCLQDLGGAVGGKTPSKADSSFWDAADICWASPKDMKAFHLESTEDRISARALDGAGMLLLPAGSTLMVTRSGILAHTFPVALTRVETTINQDIKAIRPTPFIDGRYMAYVLRSRETLILDTCRKAGTTVASVETDLLERLRLPLAPLSEQRRIADKLDDLLARVDACRDRLDRVPALLKRFRQAVLGNAFGGGLTSDWRDDNPGVEPASVGVARVRTERGTPRKRANAIRAEVAQEYAQGYAQASLPESWELLPLGDVCRLQPGYAFDSKAYLPEGVRLLRGTNIVPGATRWEDTVCLSEESASDFANYRLHAGDVVIAMDRPIISTGIKVAVLQEADMPALLLQRVGRFQLTPVLDRDFLFYFLNSDLFIRYIDGQATGTQLPHISQNDVESVRIPLPPIEEQREIVRRTRQQLEAIATTERVLAAETSRLRHLESAILSKAFRGELVPQDPNDEPVSVLLDRMRVERAASGPSPKKRGRSPKVAVGTEA